MRALLAAVFVLVVCVPAAFARKWTDATGKCMVEAAFVESKDGSVRLRLAKGETVVLRLTNLSRQDQAYVAVAPLRAKVDAAESALDTAVKAFKREQETEAPASDDAAAIEKATAYLVIIAHLADQVRKLSQMPGVAAVAVRQKIEMPDGTKGYVTVSTENARQLLGRARAALAAAKNRARTNLAAKHKEELKKRYAAPHATLAKASEVLKTATVAIEPVVDEQSKLSDALEEYQKQVDELVQRLTEALNALPPPD